MIKTVLFDLDGTLLPMDLDVFVKSYFGGLAKKMAQHGYDPEQLIGAIWQGTMAVIKNDGSSTNEALFWEKASAILGEKVLKDAPLFEEFYKNDFPKVQAVCGFSPLAARAVEILKQKGIAAVLATNPVFPAIATHSRAGWAGLNVEDFIHITTMENSRFCKPSHAYYSEILSAIGAKPEECLMVGNDVSEDMVAEQLGMQVFLLTDCLINKNGEDISRYPHGGFEELIATLSAL
jgi:FMN phosphatase YigB (HAD superfamily)